MKKNTLFIVLIISIAVVIGFWRDNQDPQLAAQKFTLNNALSTGTMVPNPQPLPQIELIDMFEKPFTNHYFNQHWTFLFFGYSSCPGICPLTLDAMHQISQRLHAGNQVQFVFISIDPDHDTPARLKQYLQQPRFKGTPFLGVTGKKPHIEELAYTLGIHIAQSKDSHSEPIEHSGTILLVNPEGNLAAIFTSSEKPHAIAHDFKQVVHRYAQAS